MQLRVSIFQFLVITTFSFCSSLFAQPQAPVNIYPMPPINNFLEGEGGFAYPHLPPFRTSFDGRVGVRVMRGAQVDFFLLGPETLETHILNETRGIKGVLDNATLSVTDFNMTDDFRGRTLCQKSTAPRVCGVDDCYDLTLIGNTPIDGLAYFVSHDLTVRVSDPKTATAKIVEVTPVPGSYVQSVVGGAFSGDSLVEPNVTQDGQLFLWKASALPNEWQFTSPVTRRNTRYPAGSRPVLYFYNDDPNKPCDITQWQTPKPLSHAPFDPAINNKYGFARYQFRDAQGYNIRDGEQIRGSQYPWLSQRGEMLLLELGGEMLFYSDDGETIRSRYPVSCGDPDSTNNCELGRLNNTSLSVQNRIERFEKRKNVNRAVMAVGLWTHGKFVELDNMLNYMDYAPNGQDHQQLKISLYEPNLNNGNAVKATGNVLIGNNKPLPRENSVNEGAQIGSPVNQFNFNVHIAPATPRDIVWQVSKGNGATVEVAFDDYIDPNVLINAPMNASSNNRKYSNLDPLREMHVFFNGFKRTGFYTGEGFVDPIFFQNAATADDKTRARGDNTLAPFSFRLPRYGRGLGNIRVEPVALGGVRGKGAWLDGSSRILFDVPAQASDWAANPWHYSIFVDPRVGGHRHLFTTPSGASVTFRPNQNFVRYYGPGGGMLREIKLPNNVLFRENWVHIAVQTGANRTRLLVNGVVVDDWKNNGSIFRLLASDLPGAFQVGGKSGAINGLVGWVDDFKVIRLGFSASTVELLCNHARGTLVGLDDNYNGPLSNMALTAGDKSFDFINEALASHSHLKRSRYACFVDYQNINGALLVNIPENTVSLREALTQSKALRANLERPDESENEFCLTCHVDNHSATLDVDSALRIRPGVLAIDDGRRQPRQPMPWIFGVIPPDLFHLGVPSSTLFPVSGVQVDQYLLAP